jgi:hypothetical protein
MANTCEDHNGHSDFVNGGKFLENLIDYRLLKMNSTLILVT